MNDCEVLEKILGDSGEIKGIVIEHPNGKEVFYGDAGKRLYHAALEGSETYRAGYASGRRHSKILLPLIGTLIGLYGGIKIGYAMEKTNQTPIVIENPR